MLRLACVVLAQLTHLLPMPYSPSEKLLELCAPLHPIEFNILYVLTYPGVHTVSTAPPVTGKMTYQLNSIRLLPVAKKLLPPIVARLRNAAKDALGSEFAHSWPQGVDHLTQGEPSPPGNMNVCLLMMSWTLHKAFSMTGYAKRMHGNLSWPGDWCCGSNTEALGRGEEDKITQLRSALQKSPHADRIIDELKEFQAFVSPKKPSGGSSFNVMSYVQAYVVFWMTNVTWLAGYRQSKEYGEMPKTAN